VASLLQASGLLRALEALPRARGLYVLNYHRIGNVAGNPLDDATFSATAEELRHQMLHLRRSFDTPPAHAVLDSLRRGRFDAPTALVTFDDGYRDNYDLAFPVLREVGVPGCFFVVPGYVDAPTVPWWDRIAYSVKHTALERFTLDYPEKVSIDLRETSRPQATRQILRAFKRAHGIDRDRFFDVLAAASGVTVDAAAMSRDLFAPWSALKEMQDGGMTIGSHTATHPVLSSLSEDDQRREIAASRERIGDALGEAPTLLAYPVGGPTAFTAVTERLAKESGYEAAFTFFGGMNIPGHCSLFALSRVGVHHADTDAQFRITAATSTVARWGREPATASAGTGYAGNVGSGAVRGDDTGRSR
jgi:peptidoglycan/xylan/chitin deacetylase (PgdA/CDA1 family)